MRVAAVFALFCIAVGCGRVGFDTVPLTGEVRDGASGLDGGVPRDGDVGPDSGAPFDAEVSSDGALPDGALPDGALPDGALPDGALPDGGLPDGAPAGSIFEPYTPCPRGCTGGCYGYRFWGRWAFLTCHVNDPVGVLSCPSGFSCSGRCTTLGSCTREIVCNDPCTVVCSGESSCSGGLRCAGGPCTFQCTGAESCGGPIVGADRRVGVTCSGPNSCAGAIDCSAACECSVDCGSAANCANLTCRPGCGSATGCTGGDCATC